jgi:hypothetical protein
MSTVPSSSMAGEGPVGSGGARSVSGDDEADPRERQPGNVIESSYRAFQRTWTWTRDGGG